MFHRITTSLRPGKTSLLASFLAGEFASPKLSCLLDQRAPSAVPGSSLTLHLVDTEPNDESLATKLNFADVILFGYSTADMATLVGVRERWIPLVSSAVADLSSKKALIVGLKADLSRAEEQETALIAQLFVDFPFLLESVRCSALTGSGVPKVFVRAELNFSYPVAPLFFNQQFTPSCYRAFKRIFRIYDRDVDGLWSVDEFRSFQESCFGLRLNDEELNLLRDRILRTNPFGFRGECLTLDGLFALLTLYVTPLTSSVWSVLEDHGYDDDIILDLPIMSTPSLRNNQVLRLSSSAVGFLTGLARYSAQALHPEDDGVDTAVLSSLFSVIEEGDLDPPAPWLHPDFPVIKVVA